MTPLKIIYLTLGWISLALGVIGLFLPIMPTTPFLIFTAFCFSRGSQRLHGWLLNLPQIGATIRDWEERGVVQPRVKLIATVTIVVSFSGTIILTPFAWYYKLAFALMGLSIIAFIVTRPSE